MNNYSPANANDHGLWIAQPTSNADYLDNYRCFLCAAHYCMTMQDEEGYKRSTRQYTEYRQQHNINRCFKSNAS